MAYEYAKVLLYAYPHLSALSEAVSVSVENKALLSFRSEESAAACAQRVVGEIAVRVRLDALADDLNAILADCSREELFLLEYKYFRRGRVLRGRFAGCTLPWSERSYFRRQTQLLKRMAFLLGARGWTRARCGALFAEYPPFARLHEALLQGRECAVSGKRARRGLAFEGGPRPG